MQLRRTILATSTALLVAGAAFLPLLGKASAGSAGDFLVTMSETAIQQLADPEVDTQAKEAKFRELVNEAFDIPRISKFILGVNWRSASEEQRAAFIQAFEESNMRRFLPFFADYKGERIEVLGERPDSNNAKLTFVNSKIERPQGEPFLVEWRLYKKDGSYKILDAVIEGVSMTLSLRQEYGSVIQQSGLDGLIAQLQRIAGSGVAAQ